MRKTIQAVLFLACGTLLILGITRGELRALFTRAVNVCMECIGLG